MVSKDVSLKSAVYGMICVWKVIERFYEEFRSSILHRFSLGIETGTANQGKYGVYFGDPDQKLFLFFLFFLFFQVWLCCNHVTVLTKFDTKGLSQ